MAGKLLSFADANCITFDALHTLNAPKNRTTIEQIWTLIEPIYILADCLDVEILHVERIVFNELAS